jgi:hypothetical protein
MTQIPRFGLPNIDLSYPSLSIDSSYGQTIQVQCFRTQLVKRYLIQGVLGSLSGGTSPAWNISASNPLVSHVSVQADNNPIVDADTQLLQFYEQVVTNDTPDGLHFSVRVSDVSLRTQEEIEATGLPAYSFNQIIMNISIPALSALTTGSPTASSGTTLYLTEESVPRSAVSFKPILVKHLQVTASQALSGTNDNVTALSQDGLYAQVFLYADTGSTGYSAPTDSAIQRISLILNSTSKIRDSYWTALKNQLKAITGFAPPTGVSALIFKEGYDANKMLDLRDTRRVTSVDLQTVTTQANVRLVLYKIEYFA